MDNKEDKTNEDSEINEFITKNQINKKDFYNEIKIIPYFASEFGLFIIILLIVLLFFLIPQYHSGKLFHSKKLNIPFDTNYIPKILFHLTDIHVSHNLPKKCNGSFIFLTSFIEYKPDLILTTGDIVDNYEGDRIGSRVGSQWLEDWEIYNNTVRNLISKYPVIDVAGNHDVWALDSATSKDNLFLDYSFMFNRENVKSEDDFIIKKVKMLGLTFILFNDYRFPIPHPPYGLDVHTSKHQLDLLENMIDNLEEGEECYILSHYNVDRVWYIKSSKGNDFYDIISNKKVAGLFTGHEHPEQVNINHHGEEGGLEYCTSSPYNNQRSGLITIDNGNLIYHDTYIPSPDKRPLFFMTYPVPNNQVSSHHIFNLKNFEIRVLSYVTDRNVTLKVEGDLNDELKYVTTLKNGAILYSLKVNNMKNGHYNIHVYDEKRELCDISRNFVVGDSYQGQREKAVKNHRAYLFLRLSSIPMLIFLFIIIFPYKFNKSIDLIENLENFIEGKKYKYISTYLIYLYLIILSPFILRNRFIKLNKFCRYSIFILSLYPIFLPIHFFNRINGKIGFAFNVFIVIGSSIKYEHWAMQMSYIYYLSIIIPNVFYLTCINDNAKDEKSFKIIYYFNLVFSYIALALALVINFTSMAQSLSLGYLFISPYIIIIVVSKIIAHKFAHQKTVKKENFKLEY